jgi:hypothetical protein
LISDATPEFLWYEVTDDWVLSHYILLIDGKDLFGDLPLTSYENSDYKLVYDSTNGIYSLTPKASLSDATHSWQVRAVDYGSNVSISDTWNFTIDTLAPAFTVTKIGDRSMSIAAGGTPPTEPIEIFANDVTANEPIIIADGERYSSVQLTVTIPDDPTQNFSKDIDENGNWQLQLGILPRETVIELDFIITDRVGLVSVLENLYIIIPQYYFPPTATPTVTTSPTGITSPSPSVSLSPEPSYTISPPPGSLTGTISPTLTISPTASPSGEIEEPGIQIPIIPPKEIIHEAAQEISERLPEKIANFLRYLFSSEFWKKIAPYFVFILLMIHLLLSYILILTKFISNFSILLLKKVLALILPFKQSRKNLVFDYRNIKASPVVKVSLIEAQTGIELDFMITNHLGNFADFVWPKDKEFKLSVRDKNFYYPIGDKKPVQLSKKQFYQDEIFSFPEMDFEPILIPTLTAQGQTNMPFLERLRVAALYILTYPWWFFGTSLLFALIITLRYGGYLNILVVIYYLLILLKKLRDYFRDSNLSLQFFLDQGQKYNQRLLVSITDLNAGESFSFLTDVDYAKIDQLKLDFGKYLLTTYSLNYGQWDYQNAVSQQQFELKANNHELAIKLKRVEFSENNFAKLAPICKLK